MQILQLIRDRAVSGNIPAAAHWFRYTLLSAGGSPFFVCPAKGAAAFFAVAP